MKMLTATILLSFSAYTSSAYALDISIHSKHYHHPTHHHQQQQQQQQKYFNKKKLHHYHHHHNGKSIENEIFDKGHIDHKKSISSSSNLNAKYHHSNLNTEWKNKWKISKKKTQNLISGNNKQDQHQRNNFNNGNDDGNDSADRNEYIGNRNRNSNLHRLDYVDLESSSSSSSSNSKDTVRDLTNIHSKSKGHGNKGSKIKLSDNLDIYSSGNKRGSSKYRNANENYLKYYSREGVGNSESGERGRQGDNVLFSLYTLATATNKSTPQYSVDYVPQTVKGGNHVDAKLDVYNAEQTKHTTDYKPIDSGTTNESYEIYVSTTVKQYAFFQNPISMQSKPNRLLGPLHGPDWLLDHTKIKKKKPLDTTTGIEGTFLWAVGLFGTVENGAIVVTTVFSKRFKKPLHMLIGTLAATDLFTSVIYIPVYTYYLLEGEQPESDPFNSLWNFCTVSRLIFIEIASVTLTIKVLIALYLNIISYSKAVAEAIFTAKTTIILIILAWVTNFGLLFVPNFLGFGNVDFYPNGVICIPGAESGKQVISDTNNEASSVDDSSKSLLAYTIVTLSFHLVELLIICVCFAKVHQAIQLGRNIWHQNLKMLNEDKKCDLSYLRAKRITILFFVNFVFCWVPIYVVNIADPSHKNLPELVHHFAMDLLLLKSAINPAIYIYGIRSLRREMKVVCMCRCHSIGKNEKVALYRTSMDSLASYSTKSAEMV